MESENKSTKIYRIPKTTQELLERYGAGERYLVGTAIPKAELAGKSLAGANLQASSLQEAILIDAHLVEVDFQKAHLVGANFTEADLRWANLQDANLHGANLQRSKLFDTRLRHANLQDCDLTGATGIQAGQFAGANLCGAKLPKAILKFEGLTQVDQISKTASKIFIAMIVGCAYSWLTLLTTTDAALVTNSVSSRLPIIQAEIPIAWFYRVSPLLLFSLYLYLHLYLQRLWEALANLPAIFTDGRSVDKTVDPWLLNGLVRSYFPRLKAQHVALSRLQNSISILLGWMLVPITVFFFWARYLPRHDWFWTHLHIVLLACSIAVGIALYQLAAATLLGKDTKTYHLSKALIDARTYKSGAIALGIGVLIYLLSLGAIEGARPMFDPPPYSGLQITYLNTLVPRAFGIIRYNPFADLRGFEISSKPENWSEEKDKEFKSIKGANLRNFDLRYAFLMRTFLVKGNLSGARLQGSALTAAEMQKANLRAAQLQGAYLFKVQLQGAFLFEADLKGAYLSGAQLQEADLRDTQLQGVHLTGANLFKADLRGADLKDALLYGAQLQDADLEYVNNLTQEQIEETCINNKTKLPDHLKRPKVCRRMELPKEPT